MPSDNPKWWATAASRTRGSLQPSSPQGSETLGNMEAYGSYTTVTRFTKKRGQFKSIGDCGVCSIMASFFWEMEQHIGKFWKICIQCVVQLNIQCHQRHLGQVTSTSLPTRGCNAVPAIQRYAAGLSLTAFLLTSKPWPGNHWTKAGPYARSEICEQIQPH